MIKIKNATKKGYLEANVGDGIDCSTRMEYHRGTVQKGIAQTLTTQIDVGVVTENKTKKESNLEIRKLTPLECCRLMGADDSVFYALRDIAKLSDIQMYHIFGDGLIASIPEKIILKMKGE